MVVVGQTPALVFCRGGSKSIPRKNIADLAGRPLISYTINQAKACPYIDNIIVSTDCPQIADIAEKNGAEVLVRPDHLATDTVSEMLAWKHAIDVLGDRLSNYMVVLPVTSPLRASQDISRAIERFAIGDSDVVFGICESRRNPYLSMVEVNQDGFLSVVNPTDHHRRQDAPKVFDICPSLYVADIEYIKKCKLLMDGKVGYIEIPSERTLDIDQPFDLHLAELLLNNPFQSD